ncbi:ABC transporter substrate-binding protein [Aquiluna sp. KACHI24]|uniref:ABC transporter substrate-binding protein n=1 Tax=Aquiluna sp. KACHI24 TaxID=2968831 RepID=UPI00220BF4A2|nr:ABC transporter substrate-binding protein [Aquiluna sp. KACHI24]BDQ00709.1 amino acid ABC transporter substrate-binding protein [Aquiluna sp. KACHI24]
MSKLTRALTALAASAAVVISLSACAPQETAETAAPEETSTTLATLTEGKLTIGTGLPAYEPWVVGDAPESGEGFEAAVAYAIAAELGFAPEDVVWVRTTFDEAIAPGAKNFDFNLQQYSITEGRKAAVDFSSPYYYTAQTVITVAGSAAEGAKSLADLQGLLIGAATGTTSLKAIEDIIKPTQGAQAFNSNDDAKAALANGQVDAIVVDLPTAFYLTAVELEGGLILGQLEGAEAGDSFGLVLDKDSPLTEAVSAAVDRLRENGTLAALEAQWLADYANAPVLK